MLLSGGYTGLHSYGRSNPLCIIYKGYEYSLENPNYDEIDEEALDYQYNPIVYSDGNSYRVLNGFLYKYSDGVKVKMCPCFPDGDFALSYVNDEYYVLSDADIHKVFSVNDGEITEIEVWGDIKFISKDIGIVIYDDSHALYDFSGNKLWSSESLGAVNCFRYQGFGCNFIIGCKSDGYKIILFDLKKQKTLCEAKVSGPIKNYHTEYCCGDILGDGLSLIEYDGSGFTYLDPPEEGKYLGIHQTGRILVLSYKDKLKIFDKEHSVFLRDINIPEGYCLEKLLANNKGVALRAFKKGTNPEFESYTLFISERDLSGSDNGEIFTPLEKPVMVCHKLTKDNLYSLEICIDNTEIMFRDMIRQISAGLYHHAFEHSTWVNILDFDQMKKGNVRFDGSITLDLRKCVFTQEQSEVLAKMLDTARKRFCGYGPMEPSLYAGSDIDKPVQLNVLFSDTE